MEAESLFSQDLKLRGDPSITLSRTDNLTGLTVTRAGNYFTQIDSVSGTTTSAVRLWDKIDNSSNILFVKGSYSSEYFEGIVKLGAANKQITRREQSTETAENATLATVVTNRTVQSSIIDIPQGFAYGFQIRAEPYATDDFSVVTDMRWNQMIYKAKTTDNLAISKSTTSVRQQNVSNLSDLDYDEINYGASLTVAMKLGAVHPYVGLGYSDGKLKVTQKSSNITETYNAAGAVATSQTTLQTTTYTLSPKTRISIIVGLSIPFEKGGVNIEGKMQGESSLKVSGFIGF